MEFLNVKMREYNIDPKNIVPHRAHATKTCYGSLLKEDWARNLWLSRQPTTPMVFAETWRDKFNRLMLATGLFHLENGRWVLKVTK
jgi:hypothetical protein